MNRGIEKCIPNSVFAAFLLTLLFLQGCSGLDTPQEEEPSDTETSQSLPPDRQAFYATYAIDDPEKRLEALNAFVNESFDSSPR